MSKSNYLISGGSSVFNFRGGDRVEFQLPGHTPQIPKTLTVSRTLPVPRKGNLGTMKVLFNCHIHENIGTVEEPVYAPVVAKFELSVPVGATMETAVRAGINAASAVFLSKVGTTDRPDVLQAVEDVFVKGLLPSDAHSEPSWLNITETFFDEPQP